MAGANDESDPEKGTPKTLVQTKGDHGSGIAAKRRIRYFDDQDEIQQIESFPANNNGKLKRKGSAYSIHSLSSIRSGQRAVDPASALPVMYRTLSMDMARTQEKLNVTVKKSEIGDKAMAGKFVVQGQLQSL